jgi:Na+-driven multidrug efflux pump
MILMPMTSAIVGTFIILFRVPLVSIFNLGSNISQYTLSTAQNVIIIGAVWAIVRNIPYLTVVGIFRPGGDTTMGMIVEIGALWCFSVPMTFIAANVLHLPFLAVYAIMYLCEDIPKGIFFIYYWISGKWIRPVTESGRAGLQKLKET